MTEAARVPVFHPMQNVEQAGKLLKALARLGEAASRPVERREE